MGESYIGKIKHFQSNNSLIKTKKIIFGEGSRDHDMVADISDSLRYPLKITIFKKVTSENDNSVVITEKILRILPYKFVE